MTNRIISTALIIALFAAQNAGADTLNITITDIEQSQGEINLGLFSAETYENGEAFNGAIIKVTGPTATATITDIEPGEYAFKLYHDVDSNGVMNTNPFGIPTEPYAFSNNALGRFGPASWDDAKFTVTQTPAEQIINLN